LGKNAAVLTEALRLAAPLGEESAEGERGEARTPAFWKLFGGTLLSVATLIVITLCQQFSAGLNDLRKDILRLSQGQGETVKEDELNSRIRPLWERVRELEADRAALAALKEEAVMFLERLRSAEQECRALAREVQGLREATVGGREKNAQELRRLRQRLAVLEGRGPTATSAAHHQDH
jgi:hypothetical protein